MGCEFDDFTDKAWTHYFESDCDHCERNEIAKTNRRMLYNAMITVGFTNLPSEWWHFDYGDDKWAQLNHTTPLYAGILDAKLRNSTSYPNMVEIQKADQLQQELLMSLIDIGTQCKELARNMVRKL